MAKIILLFGDQLSYEVSSLATYQPGDVIVMAEIANETTYVKHHYKKIVLIFSAMRHFALALLSKGYFVVYHRYSPESEMGSFTDIVTDVQTQYNINQLVLTEPGEYRVLEEIQSWTALSGLDVEILEDDRFFSSKEQFQQWAESKKQLRMEYFYRDLRKRHNILIENGKPCGGKWNFDQENRKKYTDTALPPIPLVHEPDLITSKVIQEVKSFINYGVGSIESFWFGVNHTQAEKSFKYFLENHLAKFGTYQDAMRDDSAFLFHSVISIYLNIGLLSPKHVCHEVEHYYKKHELPLNSAEGFIRQILGWREYIRGIYWYFMPEYKTYNALHAHTPLPGYYWHGDTRMYCMSSTIKDTMSHAYAHHIQRLMVTGNFALIAGLNTEQVQMWYLGVYADAFEWVELPNTLGMALHGDGGLLASKPYCSSGKYIHKMSNYCQSCHYNVQTAEETDSCPFNSLYWHFLQRHKEQFNQNPRMKLVYAAFDRMGTEKQKGILTRATALLENLDAL